MVEGLNRVVFVRASQADVDAWTERANRIGRSLAWWMRECARYLVSQNVDDPRQLSLPFDGSGPLLAAAAGGMVAAAAAPVLRKAVKRAVAASKKHAHPREIDPKVLGKGLRSRLSGKRTADKRKRTVKKAAKKGGKR